MGLRLLREYVDWLFDTKEKKNLSAVAQPTKLVEKGTRKKTKAEVSAFPEASMKFFAYPGFALIGLRPKDIEHEFGLKVEFWEDPPARFKAGDQFLVSGSDGAMNEFLNRFF